MQCQLTVYLDRFAPNELEKRVDEVLYYVWDPIGVNEEPYARAEYRSYVSSVLGCLVEGKTASEIADYLCKIESESMWLSPNKQSALKVANALIQNKKAIDEGCA
jgi:hypothetical protein